MSEERKEKILSRLDDVINFVDKSLKTTAERLERDHPGGTLLKLTNPNLSSRLLSMMMHTLSNVVPPGDTYLVSAHNFAKTNDMKSVFSLFGILESVRMDYKKDNFSSIGELIDAELFSDILDQASYLFSQNWISASAVVAGVALESQLRKLADKNGIPKLNNGRYKNADALNSTLHSIGLYGTLEQKQILMWLEVRKKGAHPDKQEINRNLMEPMNEGIREFIAKYPA